MCDARTCLCHTQGMGGHLSIDVRGDYRGNYTNLGVGMLACLVGLVDAPPSLSACMQEAKGRYLFWEYYCLGVWIYSKVRGCIL